MSSLGLVFRNNGYGRHGYRSSAVAAAGGVHVYWDGALEGMGVHVQISGEGCRLIEAGQDFTSWQDWIGCELQKGVKVKRIDLAIDDLSGEISFDTVYRAVRSGSAVTRAKRGNFYLGWKGDREFPTLYVGSRSSATMMRCYDKGRQKGEEKSRLRFEFEHKGTKADAIARILVEKGWDAAIGASRAFIEFKDETHKTTDRTRQRPAQWWVDFIGASKHEVHLERHAHESFTKTHGWVKRQVGPAIALLLAYDGGDLTSLLEIAKDGRARWTERHERILLNSVLLGGSGGIE